MTGEVQEMRRCGWCRETRPVVHDCAGDPTPCEARREDGEVCGICPACLAAQESDPRYRRRSADDTA